MTWDRPVRWAERRCCLSSASSRAMTSAPSGTAWSRCQRRHRGRRTSLRCVSNRSRIWNATPHDRHLPSAGAKALMGART
eukprot:16446420-Heterocapsa_arctica.AAC.1